jgi:hypothetical protein
MRILLMLTAGRGSRTRRSLGLDQVVEAFYLLQDAGVEVVVVSIRGGYPPFRGSRSRSARSIAALGRFRGDHRARETISDTLTFAQIFPEDFNGGVCVGALEAQPGNDDEEYAVNLIAALLAEDKPTAVVPGDLFERQVPPTSLLIAGDQTRSPLLAARALLAALGR